MQENRIFLKQTLAMDKSGERTSGNIKGVAYTGAVISEHGFVKNLVVDLKSLSVKKEITPIFRDHSPSQVAGRSTVSVNQDNVTFEGVISSKTQHGQEILALSDDGFEWEISMGIYGGQMIEVEDETINGHEIRNGVVLKNGVIREISIVALGADSDTSAEFFSIKQGEHKMSKYSFTQEQWAKFACGCGGTAETTPDEMEKKFADEKAKAEELQKQIDALKAEVAAKQAELDKIKEQEELSAREAQITAALSAKNIEMSQEKIKEAAKSNQTTELMISFIGEMKAQDKKINPAMAGKQDLGADLTASNKTEDVIAKAELMVKEGKAKDLFTAINILEVK